MNRPEWKSRDDGSLRMILDVGEELREACVNRGGNGLWTVWIEQRNGRRLFKRSKKRINGKVIVFEMLRPQAKTQREAIAWAETTWDAMQDLYPIHTEPQKGRSE